MNPNTSATNNEKPGNGNDRSIAALYNPFSLKTNQPKWPDGKATYSLGIKTQRRDEFMGKDFVCCLFPGLTNYFFVYHQDEAPNSAPNIKVNHNAKLLETKIIEALAPDKYNYEFSSGLVNENTMLVSANNIYDAPLISYRPVSLGLKLQCINGDERNDGWFEAIRTSRSSWVVDMGAVADSNIFYPAGLNSANPYENYVTNANVFPFVDLAQKWYRAADWALQPTYVTGKIKDLSQYIFQCNPIRDDNDFKTIPRRLELPPTISEGDYRRLYTSDAGSNFYVYNHIDVGEPNNKTTPMEDTINEKMMGLLSHESHDTILIRLHGVNAETRYLAHTVYNAEYMVPEYSEMGLVSSNCYNLRPALEKYKSYRLSIAKPLQPLYSSFR